jgi:diaminopimelate decarboxylase
MAYPLKTNNNPYLLRRIAALGAVAVVDDADEISRAKQAGFKEIIFTGITHDNEETIVGAIDLDCYILCEKY